MITKLKLICVFTSTIVLAACSSSSSEESYNGGASNDATDISVTVIEYLPAPGQFVNEFLELESDGSVSNVEVTTMEQAKAWAQKQLDSNDGYVSLGAFGGYLIVKMPYAVKNRTDKYDFGVIGNPFEGSSEPGVVWVSEDINGNGLADDLWYELSGSGYDEDPQGVTRNYKIKYYKTDTPGDVRWECVNSLGGVDSTGVIKHNAFHTQDYFPAWAVEHDSWNVDNFTVTGTMLPSRVTSTTHNGETVWSNNAYEWGYVDNMGNDAKLNSNGLYSYNQFDIANAIDENGNPVHLDKIHFVKIQSAVLRNVERIGEVSTEVFGFKIF